MMRSDAWRDMKMNDRRMVDLLEAENMSHAGRENGNLKMTYNQFAAGGIRREAISPTISHLEELGWLRVARGLYRGFARTEPHRFRLTYRPTWVFPEVGAPNFVGPTDDWRRYRSKKSRRMVPESELAQFRNRYGRSENAKTQPVKPAQLDPPLAVPNPVPPYISGAEAMRGRGCRGSRPKFRHHRD